jgi:hypothetical protein
MDVIFRHQTADRDTGQASNQMRRVRATRLTKTGFYLDVSGLFLMDLLDQISVDNFVGL